MLLCTCSFNIKQRISHPQRLENQIYLEWKPDIVDGNITLLSFIQCIELLHILSNLSLTSTKHLVFLETSVTERVISQWVTKLVIEKLRFLNPGTQQVLRITRMAYCTIIGLFWIFLIKTELLWLSLTLSKLLYHNLIDSFYFLKVPT